VCRPAICRQQGDHLGDNKLEDITIESPAGRRRRFDIEVGFVVFEVKRDLRVGNVRSAAVIQLMRARVSARAAASAGAPLALSHSDRPACRRSYGRRASAVAANSVEQCGRGRAPSCVG
jgi:hypothetical protein